MAPSAAAAYGRQLKIEPWVVFKPEQWYEIPYHFHFFSQEGSWAWESGANWSYSNWLKGQPSGGESQNCLILLTGNERKWDDLSCLANQFEFPLCMMYH